MHVHAFGMKLVSTWQTHYPADSVDVLFQTDDTFALLASVLSPPLG